MSPSPLPPRYSDAVLLGVGGMAEVYSARDVELDRRVAVKVLAPHLAREEEFRLRFRREARAAARIAHPRVVAVHDVGEWQGRPYLVMEYVGGGSIGAAARGGQVPAPRALEWVRDAADALDAAHRQGVVHRDVKPANLLLDSEGRVKVADFGIARVLEAGGPALTATGAVVGTVGYLAPEQLRGERAGPAADVYALAVVAYELLAGERPFAGRSTAAEISAQLHEEPPPPSRRAAWLPAAVDAVVARALAKDPSARPPSAGRLAGELAAALGAPAPATEATAEPPTRVLVGEAPGPPPRGPRPRRGVALAAGAVLALAVVAAAAGALALRGGDGEPAGAERAVTVVRQVTSAAPPPEVRTVTERGPAATVTREVPVPVRSPEPAPGEAASVAEARRLTDEGWRLIQDGRPDEAAAVMARALPALEGTGDPYEGNAYYNMGRALLDLGQCEDAVPYLEAAVAAGGSGAQMAVRRDTLGAAVDCDG